jgi:hypothetical protein
MFDFSKRTFLFFKKQNMQIPNSASQLLSFAVENWIDDNSEVFQDCFIEINETEHRAFHHKLKNDKKKQIFTFSSILRFYKFSTIFEHSNIEIKQSVLTTK